MQQFHQAGRGHAGLRGGLGQGVSAQGKLRLRTIGVGLIALTGAGESRGQIGESLRVIERLPGDGLLLAGAEQIEVAHGDEQEQVVRGGRDRVLPGRHLLVRNAGLEDGVGHGELGRYAGNSRSAATHRIHAQAGFQRRAVGHGDRAIAVLQRAVMVLVVDAGANVRQPQHLGSLQLGKGLVDLRVGKGHLRIAGRDYRQGTGETDDLRVLRGYDPLWQRRKGRGHGGHENFPAIARR